MHHDLYNKYPQLILTFQTCNIEFIIIKACQLFPKYILKDNPLLAVSNYEIIYTNISWELNVNPNKKVKHFHFISYLLADPFSVSIVQLYLSFQNLSDPEKEESL